jgi:hypothetical protein
VLSSLECKVAKISRKCASFYSVKYFGIESSENNLKCTPKYLTPVK